MRQFTNVAGSLQYSKEKGINYLKIDEIEVSLIPKLYVGTLEPLCF